jgi:hypothetical protein
MDSIAERVQRDKQIREDATIERAFEGLAAVFRLLRRLGRSQRLVEMNEMRKEAVRNLLRQQHWLCPLILDFVEPPEDVAAHLKPGDMLDPMVQSNLCVLLSHLVDEYPKCFDGTDQRIVNHWLRRAMSLSIDSWLKGVASQAERLASAISDIVDMINRIRPPGSRVVLLELPIGNSIPVRMLERKLGDAGHKPLTVCVSLSRNDSAGQGPTRSSFLSQIFTEFGFLDSDVVLYCDEWYSGANFKNLCKLAAKSAKKSPCRVNFLPVALVSANAHKDHRFPDFLRKHEVFVRQAGLGNTDGLFIFPPIESRFMGDGRLFWAERDRMAGYRKMQYQGTIFATLDAAIEELMGNPEALKVAQRLFCGHGAGGHEVTEDLVNDTDGFRHVFAMSYRDYQSCRASIANIDHATNLGKVTDPDKAFRELIDQYERILGNRPARLCALVAMIWSWENHRCDYESQYPFPSHVPVVRKLEGGQALLHEMLVDKLLLIGKSPIKSN